MRNNRIDEIQRKYKTGKYKKKEEETRVKIEEAEYKLKNKSKNKKKSLNEKLNIPLLRIYIPLLFLISTIIIISIFQNRDLKSYVSKLIIDNKEVATNAPIYLKKDGEILLNQSERDKAVIYISIEDIKKHINKNLLYNEKEKEIVLTSKTNLIQILLEKGDLNINGSKTKLKEKIFKEGIYTYIPVNEIIDKLGYDLIISEEFNVILDNKEKGLKTLKLKENTDLKNGKNIFAKKIMELNEKDTYILVEEFPKVVKIRTKGGIYGYINKNKIQNIVAVRKEEKEAKKENYNFIFNYQSPGDNPDFIVKDKNKKNAVLSNMFKVELDSNGFKIKENFDMKSESYNKYINKIVNYENMEVFAKIFITKDASKKLDIFNYRIDLIQKIADKLKEYNLDKVFIDFEDTKDPAAISRFLIELKSIINNSSKKTLALPDKDIFKVEVLYDIVDYNIKVD